MVFLSSEHPKYTASHILTLSRILQLPSILLEHAYSFAVNRKLPIVLKDGEKSFPERQVIIPSRSRDP